MSEQGHEQHQETFFDRMQAASLDVPEGATRDQFSAFVLQARDLLTKHGVRSEEEFLAINWTTETYSDLAHYAALFTKLNEILDTKELVVDDLEYRVDIGAYEDFEFVGIVQGEMYVVVKDTEGHVLLDQQGQVLIKHFDIDTLVVHTRGKQWFLEAVLDSGENVLVNSHGKVLEEGFREVKFVDWSGDIAYQITSNFGDVQYQTAEGEYLVHPGKYRYRQTFSDSEESFHKHEIVKSRRYQLFDGQGNKIGKEYQNMGLLQKPGCWFIALAKGEDGNSYLVDREGNETLFDKEFDKVVAVGQKGARFYSNEWGSLRVYNEKAELVFGPDKDTGIRFDQVKMTVRQGEKTYFVVVATNLDDNKKSEILLDENGEHVSFAGRELSDCLAESVMVQLFGKDRIYFGMDYGESYEVVDSKGNTYDRSAHRLEAVAEIDGVLYLQELLNEDSWEVRDQNGKMWFYKEQSEEVLNNIYRVGERMYVTTSVGRFYHLYDSEDSNTPLLSGNEIKVVQEGDVAYAITNPGGSYVQVMDLATKEKTPEYSFLNLPPIIMGEKIIMMASLAFDGRLGLYDQTGHAYDVPGELCDIAPYNDTHILVAYEHEGQMYKKHFEIL